MPYASCVASWPSGQPFPPERFATWLAAIVNEILEERCVSSRGRRIPRGLKRKMSGYSLRRARAPSQVSAFRVKIRFAGTK
jgi:hypothetical protein